MLARISRRLGALDLSEREASRRATGNEFAIRNLKRGSTPGVDLFQKLAPVLGTSAAYLAYGDGAEEGAMLAPPQPAWPPRNTIPLIGEVAAGPWLPVDQEVDAPLYDDIAVPPDPNHPADWQFAAMSRGTSVNKIAPDGSILVCIDLRKARMAPRPRDLVIVEQRRAGGLEIMRTAKRYVETADGYELWPDSTDPRWQQPIAVAKGAHDDGIEIEVIGKVTFIFAPIERLDREKERERDRGNVSSTRSGTDTKRRI